jgi:hypothetical protein
VRRETDCDEEPGPEAGEPQDFGRGRSNGRRVAGVERRYDFVRREKL